MSMSLLVVAGEVRLSRRERRSKMSARVIATLCYTEKYKRAMRDSNPRPLAPEGDGLKRVASGWSKRRGAELCPKAP